MLPAAGSEMTLFWVWLTCGITIVCGMGSSSSGNNCNRINCTALEYDSHMAVCCENCLYPGAGLSCCGTKSFNPAEATCCTEKKGHILTANVALGLSQCVSCCCGLEAFNPLNEICCGSTVIVKTTANAECCDKVAFDPDNELCCGPIDDRVVLKRSSKHHECCKHGQYDTWTQCCCDVDGAFRAQPITAICCPKEAALNHAQVYMDRHIWAISKHCRGTLCRLAKHGALRCDEILHTDRVEVEQFLDFGLPYHLVEGTICCSKFHASPGQHCCGKEVYEPHREICCNEHRHPKVTNLRCCGAQAYNFKNRQMKCCAGTLHNLMPGQSADEVQCCGSTLQKPSDVCCRSEDMELLYSAKLGFRCCGHSYYNTSLWSCCAGRLYNEPEQHRSNLNIESGPRSLNSLDEEGLCRQMYIGIVDSVSLHSIVFSSVVKIHGWNSTVEHLTSTHYLSVPDYCNTPKLTPGETYFFNEHHVFTDFNHDSIYKSLQFIIYKCYHP